MIAAWQVVGVLVPLCSASACAGYAYAQRIARIDMGVDEEPPVVAPLPEPRPRPERRSRPQAGEDPIDLSERLGPFGPAQTESAS